jgi:hypothetical protein
VWMVIADVVSGEALASAYIPHNSFGIFP